MPIRGTNSYPTDWPQVARAVKDAAGWHCIRCEHAHDVAAGYTLTVHHLDGDKANCRWWNLVALCQRCHLHIQAKVRMDQMWPLEHSEWFKPYAAGWYAWRYLGLELSREETVARMDELLRLERMV